jgi:hypothetical protein
MVASLFADFITSVSALPWQTEQDAQSTIIIAAKLLGVRLSWIGAKNPWVGLPFRIHLNLLGYEISTYIYIYPSIYISFGLSSMGNKPVLENHHLNGTNHRWFQGFSNLVQLAMLDWRINSGIDSVSHGFLRGTPVSDTPRYRVLLRHIISHYILFSFVNFSRCRDTIEYHIWHDIPW